MIPTSETVSRFTGRVGDYIQFRPGYPPGVLDAVQSEWDLGHSSTIADIGCGPGTSSELFLNAGFTVIGVEPNTEMRLAAQLRFSNCDRFSGIDGTAESTTLPADTVDLVIAAQAFHWFNISSSRREFARILRPPGRVAILFNTLRTDTPFLREYEELLQRFGTDYRQVHHKKLSDVRSDQLFVKGWKKHTFDNLQSFDLDGVRGRLNSSSFIPEVGHPNYESMMQTLNELFNRSQVNGQVCFRYDTELYLGLVEPS